MIICRTPFRISFFGGGTDYPCWYRRHGGAVLAATIDKYCWLTCRHLPPFFEHRIRVVYRKIETVKGPEQIEHPVVRAALQHLSFDRGLELHHDGDLPARSGMGSSSAFTVGLLHALHTLRGDKRTKMQLAQDSIEIEQNVLGETVGSQDQVLAAIGGLKYVQFRPDGGIAVDPLPLAPERINDLHAHLMLFYTGIARTASDVAKSYVDNVAGNRRQLHAMREMVEEAIDILVSGMDLREFGELLHEAWQTKRTLSDIVSNPQVDALYDRARAAGAIGGKLTGAGGGGFLLLFVPPDKRTRVIEKLDDVLHVPFEFESAGSQIVFNEPGVDYQEAEDARRQRPAPAFRELPTAAWGIMNRQSRIYVAGGETLLGRALIDRLIRGGFNNVVGVPPLEPDLTHADGVEAFFTTTRPEYVVVTAGQNGGIEENRRRPADLMLDNLLVAAHLIPAAVRHGVEKLLYVGSSCCYPRIAEQPLRVECLMTGALEPTNDAYATAKLAGLKLCQAYRQQFNVPFITALPANMFGPGDDFGPATGHVVAALMRRMHDAKDNDEPALTIWGTGLPRRDFIYVNDVADACVFLMDHYDEAAPINIGSGQEWTIAETAELIAEVVGYRGRLEFDAAKPDGMPRKVLDAEPLFELGWQPATEFGAALAQTYEWFTTFSPGSKNRVEAAARKVA